MKKQILSQSHTLELKQEKPNNLQAFESIEDSQHQQRSSSHLSKRKKRINKLDKTIKAGGRPKNSDQQIQYTKQSNKFSVPIWHFSRAMVFLHLLTNKNSSKQQPLTLNSYQAVHFYKAFQFMASDNFPSFQQWKYTFILHPNSLHSFLQNQKSLGIQQVTQLMMKMYLFACLYRRNLLSPYVYTYVSNFWVQIVKLAKRGLMDKEEKKSKNQERYIQYEEKNSDSKSDLVNQLKEDFSIAAYEIACYIKACCEISKIRLRN